MSISTERFKQRVITLKECFHPAAMESYWQKIVKDGMRKQELLDLHDYYDFHMNRKTLIPIIINQIINGIYAPKSPQIIRKEKKYGVCRHIQIPSPDDALVLQTLVEKITPTIIKSQPSERAYYSRSHRSPKSESDIDEKFSYEWWKLWPEFQERIFEFSKTFDYVVVTDVANYYDNISFSGLRNVISSYGNFEEELLDFLFFMLESFVWRPDYLPLSGFGLPQVNFDAPRLLGHSFLFEIDQYLSQSTDENFVRWMDDIDFGVHDLSAGKKILRDLDELLLTRGLRLNMGKTKILSSQDARKYFMLEENRYLNILNKRIERKKERKEDMGYETKKLKSRFVRFLKSEKQGRWGKVYKRYFTLAKKIENTFLENYVPNIIRDSPEIRESAFTYYLSLGYSRKRFNQLIDFFLTQDCFCDVTVFSVARILTSWEIPCRSKSVHEAVDAVKNRLKHFQSPSSFVAALWILSKYSSESDLFSIIWSNRVYWESSDFASRQVACITPILSQEKQYSQKIERVFVETGRLQAIRVMESINLLRNLTSISQDIDMYLTQKNREIYPLSKFLILISILQSPNISLECRKDLQEKITSNVMTDQVYLKMLKRIC